jgi:hypothetical protein
MEQLRAVKQKRLEGECALEPLFLLRTRLC